MNFNTLKVACITFLHTKGDIEKFSKKKLFRFFSHGLEGKIVLPVKEHHFFQDIIADCKGNNGENIGLKTRTSLSYRLCWPKMPVFLHQKIPFCNCGTKCNQCNDDATEEVEIHRSTVSTDGFTQILILH